MWMSENQWTRSLCDYSLWARGADAKEFGKILDEV